MKVLKTILFIPVSIIKIFLKGFNTLSLFLSRGFYFYLEKFFTFLGKIIPIKKLNFFVGYFKKCQEQPSHIVMLIIWFLCLLYLFDALHADNGNYVQAIFDNSNSSESEIVEKKDKKDDNLLFNKEINLFRIYGKYKLTDINFEELKKSNADTVAWIVVEGTNINYPVVQTSDNDYYLSHSFDKSYSTGGWTFMDYRNDRQLSDKNTIFYGHNLLNKTSFGSLSKVFSSKKSDVKILVLTPEGKTYTYQVFSGYIIEPEVYYLQTNFYTDSEYQTFIDTLVNRNTITAKAPVSVNDKIITLSTCTDDNKGRRVIHAKLVQES